MEHPITSYRRDTNLTQAAFGDLVGATKGMVSKWEAFKTLPRPRIMERIENVTAMQVTASQLIRAFNSATEWPADVPRPVITREAAE